MPNYFHMTENMPLYTLSSCVTIDASMLAFSAIYIWIISVNREAKSRIGDQMYEYQKQCRSSRTTEDARQLCYFLNRMHVFQEASSNTTKEYLILLRINFMIMMSHLALIPCNIQSYLVIAIEISLAVLNAVAHYQWIKRGCLFEILFKTRKDKS